MKRSKKERNGENIGTENKTNKTNKTNKMVMVTFATHL